jgi:hypothetical protein
MKSSWQETRPVEDAAGEAEAGEAKAGETEWTEGRQAPSGAIGRPSKDNALSM